MSKTMAEVLAVHDDWNWSISAQSVGCDGCDWSLRLGPDDCARDYFWDHQAAALAAEGYGSIRQAQEVAWAKGAMAAGMNLFVLQDAGINPNPYRGGGE